MNTRVNTSINTLETLSDHDARAMTMPTTKEELDSLWKQYELQTVGPVFWVDERGFVHIDKDPATHRAPPAQVLELLTASHYALGIPFPNCY